jgi:hypothetical protein
MPTISRPSGQRHRFGCPGRLQRRQVGDGKLRGGDGDDHGQTTFVPLTAAQVSEVPWMLRMKNRWKISSTTSVFIAMVCASARE